MSNPFCRFLSNGAKFNVEGNQLVWRPCCYFLKTTPVTDSVVLKKEMDRVSAATEWLAECNICQQMEKANIDALSPRKISFNRVPSDFNNGEWIDLEVSVDTTCNAACIMCSPWFSSTWAKFSQNNKLGPAWVQSPSSINARIQQIIDTFPLDQVRSVFILGGEPFFSDSHITLLKHITKVHKSLDQVRLSYSTNGSIAPCAESLALWRKFKDVTINLSIDGIKERFEYLRWPIKWDTVTKVVDYYVNHTNVILNVNCTVTPLNAWYVQEVQEWATNTIPSDRIKTSQIRLNRAFDLLDLAKTPRAYREELVNKLGAEHTLNKVISGLHVWEDSEAMLKRLAQIDSLRNLYWRDVFPDVVPYFNNVK